MSTQETIRLYDNDAYATEFEAAVLSCEPKADTDNLYEVVLDQTLFSRRRVDKARIRES